MRDDIKVSVVVPCYKVEKYLPRCLDSLKCQTFQEYEVICVNDGSPDRCIDVLREYEPRFEGRMVVIDKSNEGVWRARRDAIAVARGEYIGFVDGDDYVEPVFLEVLYQAAKTAGADIAVCGFRRIENETGKVLSTEMNGARSDIIVPESPERVLELNGAPWNKLFSSSVLKDLPELDENPQIFEDIMMHLLVYPRCSRITYSEKALVNYQVHSDSMMSTIDQSKIASTYRCMLSVRDRYKENNWYGDWREILDVAAFLHLGVSLMFRVSYDASANLGSVLKENRSFLRQYFSTWDSSRIVSMRNAKRFGGMFLKLYLLKWVYKCNALQPALAGYRCFISKMHRDIKW